MEGRERRHPSFIDTQAGSATASKPVEIIQAAMGIKSNPLSNMVVQAAIGIPLDSPDNIAVQSAPAIKSNLMDRVGVVLEAEADQQVDELPPLARLVFYVLSDRTAIFPVTSDGRVEGHVVPLGRDAIANRVARLRRAINVDEVTRGLERKLMPLPEQVERVEVPPVKLETLLQDLYAELIAPVADVLPTDETPVAIEPHCSLWLLPFAALQLPDGTWMGDRWSVIYAPSAYTLDEIRQEPCYTPLANSKILAVGNPIMPMVPSPNGVEIALQPLLGAEAEVKSITQLNPYAATHTLDRC